MHYDFETIIPRCHVGSSKWKELKKISPNIPDTIIPFSVADMEFLNAPEIIEGLKKFLDHTVLGYSGSTSVFKEIVCDWMKRKKNWDAKPEWLNNINGIVSALFMMVQTFTNPGDGVLLLTPIYYPMYKAITNNNRKLVESPLIYNGSRYEIDFDDFAKKAADPTVKLFMMSSPHNPCSRVWTRGELEKLGKICNEHHILVISDEIHFDLIMPGYKHTVYASISEEFANNCIICTSPSKTFNLAGMQLSNIFIPNKELRDQYKKMLRTISLSRECNILGYQSCMLAYEHGETWLIEVLKIIDKNKKIVEIFLQKEFPQIRVTPLEGTYLLWMNFNEFGIDYKELERINKEEAHLFFDEGYIFGDGGKGFERWNLACPTKYIYEGLERLKNSYKKYSS